MFATHTTLLRTMVSQLWRFLFIYDQQIIKLNLNTSMDVNQILMDR